MPQRSQNPAGTVTVSAGFFKDKSLALVNRVARTGEEIVVTVRGEPRAKLVPAIRRAGNRFVGSGEQAIRVVGGAAALAALTESGAPTLNGQGAPLALPPAGGDASGDMDGPRRLVTGALGVEGDGAKGGGAVLQIQASIDESDGADAYAHADDADLVFLPEDEALLSEEFPDGDR